MRAYVALATGIAVEAWMGLIVSHPLMSGTVQLPPDGLPIVMLVNGPTIGGYPVLGVVPTADLPRLGQLRPGDEV